VITGFRQSGISVQKGHRPNSSYSVLRRWKLALDSVTSFSEMPLIAIFYLGLGIMGVSALMAVWLLGSAFVMDQRVEGWASVMLSVWFLGGLLIFCIGVIGIYISKIFLETKRRPYTIVRRIHGEVGDKCPIREELG
jgi:putative glycosyltransferase